VNVNFIHRGQAADDSGKKEPDWSFLTVSESRL
jgi:hypothetical protein